MCPSMPTTRRSAPNSCSARRAVKGVITGPGVFTPADPNAARSAATTSSPGTPRTRAPARSRSLPPPTVDDDAWIIFTSGSTGVPKGVAVTHRSAAAFVDAEARLFLQAAPLGARRSRARRTLRRVRRVVRGDVARVAARRLPRARAARAGALRRGPRPVARRPRHHRRLDRADARGAVAAGRDRERAAADLRRRGLPARARRPAGRRRPGAVEHLRPDRGDGRRLRGAPGRRRAPSASASRWTAGHSRSSTPPATLSPTARSGELIIGGVGLARYLDPAKDAEKYAPMPTLGWDRAYRSGDLVRARSGGPALPGPRRRSGQGRRTAHRARRGRVRAPVAHARCRRRPWSSSARRRGIPLLVGYVVPAEGFDRQTARAELAADPARAAHPAPRRSSTTCPCARPARSTRPRCRGR